MVKATGTDGDGRPLTVFGLDPENLRRLQADKPIRVDMATMGRPEMGVILIVFGDTHEAIAKLLGAADLLEEPKGNA